MHVNKHEREVLFRTKLFKVQRILQVVRNEKRTFRCKGFLFTAGKSVPNCLNARNTVS